MSMSATPTEIAWAVGLFEGEGCISEVHRNRDPECRYRTVTLKLGSTDKDVVERFAAIVGVGGIQPKVRRLPSYKDQWIWQCTKRDDVRSLIALFRPLLGSRRRAKADAAIEWLDASPVSPRQHDPETGRFLPVAQ